MTSYILICSRGVGISWPKTSQHLSASEETEDNKKSFKIVMFNSQKSRVNRSHGLKKKKEGKFKKLGLAAAQCNGIAASFTVKYIHYCTLLY